MFGSRKRLERLERQLERAEARAERRGKLWERALVANVEDRKKLRTIDIVFDGPPGNEGPRFIEVENQTGASISIGEWVKRDDGLWALRLKGVYDDKKRS